MPSTFLRVSAIGRSAHPSLIALAAYRAGERLFDERLNRHYDDSDRIDVAHREMLRPNALLDAAWADNRALVWNLVQNRDPGARASLAREILVTLPSELSDSARVDLARSYARAVTEQTGAVVDLTVHLPREDGDERNHHAHLLLSARRLTQAGFGERITLAQNWPELKAQGLPAVPRQIENLKALWIETGNATLEKAGIEGRLSDQRVDDLGIRIPVKPGWSRAVEERIRSGQESIVVERELRRYDYELQRQALALKALENERLAARLRAPNAPNPSSDRQSNDIHRLPSAPGEHSNFNPSTEPMPTNFAEWRQWRAKQRFELPDQKDRAIAEWRRLRALALAPPNDRSIDAQQQQREESRSASNGESLPTRLER